MSFQGTMIDEVVDGFDKEGMEAQGLIKHKTPADHGLNFLATSSRLEQSG